MRNGNNSRYASTSCENEPIVDGDHSEGYNPIIKNESEENSFHVQQSRGRKPSFHWYLLNDMRAQALFVL